MIDALVLILIVVLCAGTGGLAVWLMHEIEKIRS